MAVPEHPFDSSIAMFGWRRATLNDLTASATPVRIAFIVWLPVEPGEPPEIGVTDLYLQVRGTKVFGRPTVLDDVVELGQVFTRAGELGVKPVAFGLAPCDCADKLRWNPIVLPLIWEAPMVTTFARLGKLAQQYAAFVQMDGDWKCQNPVPMP